MQQRCSECNPAENAAHNESREGQKDMLSVGVCTTGAAMETSMSLPCAGLLAEFQYDPDTTFCGELWRDAWHSPTCSRSWVTAFVYWQALQQPAHWLAPGAQASVSLMQAMTHQALVPMVRPGPQTQVRLWTASAHLQLPAQTSRGQDKLWDAAAVADMHQGLTCSCSCSCCWCVLE